MMTQIKLEFAVFGDLLDPKLFSDIAKQTPTSFWFKGDGIPGLQNIVRKETCWEYSFEFVHTRDFEDVSKVFVIQFGITIDDMIIYINENDLEVKVDIVVEIFENETPSVYFNKEFLKMITRLNGEIDVDLYILSNNVN